VFEHATLVTEVSGSQIRDASWHTTAGFRR
jgi:hypothetical protein